MRGKNVIRFFNRNKSKNRFLVVSLQIVQRMQKSERERIYVMIWNVNV